MDLKCPRCDGQLQDMNFNDFNQGYLSSELRVDKCESCGGIWFDKGELEQVDGIVDVALIEIRKIPGSGDQYEPLLCPKCKASAMDKIQNTRDRNVVMDVCPNCKGVWLDAGELEAIQTENVFKSFINIVGWILRN